MLQVAAQRPDFPTIQQRLARFASETFQCSADDALRAKHLKERALLDQILPPKVYSHALSHNTLHKDCCPTTSGVVHQASLALITVKKVSCMP